MVRISQRCGNSEPAKVSAKTKAIKKAHKAPKKK